MIVLCASAAVLALLAAFACWRFYFFHRNPVRVPPPGDGPVCPADGRILYVEDALLAPGTDNPYHRRVQSAFAVEGAWTVVATYLSIFDVHYVRAPVAGRVRLVHVQAVTDNASMGGSFLYAALRRPLPLGRRGYTEKNEFLGVSIDAPGVRILLVLMADWWIDQIVALVDDGASVERGQLIGKIQMGSQVDLWTATGALVLRVSDGQAVRAGETLL
jgi:phosphatidylserine decarboxylase